MIMCVAAERIQVDEFVGLNLSGVFLVMLGHFLGFEKKSLFILY